MGPDAADVAGRLCARTPDFGSVTSGVAASRPRHTSVSALAGPRSDGDTGLSLTGVAGLGDQAGARTRNCGWTGRRSDQPNDDNATRQWIGVASAHSPMQAVRSRSGPKPAVGSDTTPGTENQRRTTDLVGLDVASAQAPPLDTEPGPA